MPRESMDTLATKDQGLLLAILLFGSKESDELLSFLADDLAAPVKRLVDERLTLERGERIQLAVTGLERLLGLERLSRLNAIDPSWINDLLKREDPALAKLIRSVLPNGKREPSALSAEKAANLRRAVEQCFAPMPIESIGQELKISNLLNLSATDLQSLAQKLGRLYLATALSMLGKKHTATFLNHYGPAVQDAMVQELKDQSVADFMNVDAAKALLAAAFARFHDSSDLLTRAGIFALSELLQGARPDLIRPLAQRFIKNLGRLLIDFSAQVPNIEPEALEKRRQTILKMVIQDFFPKCRISSPA